MENITLRKLNPKWLAQPEEKQDLLTPSKPRPEDAVTCETPWGVLRAAANLLEHKGWIRGRLHFRHRSCALGAIEWSAKTVVARTGAQKALEAGLTELGNLRSIIHWNDCMAENKKEVMAVMRKVANAAETKAKQLNEEKPK